MTKSLKSKAALPSVSSRGDVPFRTLIIALSLVIVAAFVLAVVQLGGQSLPTLREFGLSFLTRETALFERAFGVALTLS